MLFTIVGGGLLIGLYDAYANYDARYLRSRAGRQVDGVRRDDA